MGSLLLLKVALRFFFPLSLSSNKELWIFCLDPKYHAEDFNTFGRKESPCLSSWRLDAPWPTSCCSPISIHRPGKVIITDLVLPEEKNCSCLEFETLAEYLRKLTRDVGKVLWIQNRITGELRRDLHK